MLDRTVHIDSPLVESAKVAAPTAAVLSAIHIIPLTAWAQLVVLILTAARILWAWRRDIRRDRDSKRDR